MDTTVTLVIGIIATLVVGIIGAILGWLVGRHFYQRSSRDIEQATGNVLRATAGLFNEQLKGIQTLMSERFSRMITALVVAGLIPREQEERAQQIARGEAQHFRETASTGFQISPSVIDNLVRRVWTDPSSGSAHGPEGPMGETKSE